MSYKSVRLNLKILSLSFHLLSFLFIKLYALNHLQDHTERYQSTLPYHFLEKFFFYVKSENIKFLHVNNMIGLSLLNETKVTKSR